MKKRTLSLFEAVMIIVGSVIGAGVLGIPYVVAQVGFWVGLLYIAGLGFVMILLHLFLGEIVLRTKKYLQIGGLCEKYLGKKAGGFMKLLMLLMLTSALVAYIVGMGEAAQAIFINYGIDIPAYAWSIIAWLIGSIVVIAGVRTLAHIEFVLASVIFVIIIIIAALAAPHIEVEKLMRFDLAQFFLPYGVVLFAFHGTNAIAEVEEIMPNQQKRMKQVIILAGVLPIIIYILFALAVVGVTGINTTEIATVGLGKVLGPGAIVFGNLFALFAMMTSFFALGFALRRTYEWDFNFKKIIALLLTLCVPILIFILGLRNFIATIGIAGALFGSIEAIMIIMMFWRARKKGDMSVRAYALHGASFVAVLLFLVFLVGGVYGLFEILF